MKKILSSIEEIFINNNRKIILKNYLSKSYIWAEVYIRENSEDKYIGFYGNSLDKRIIEYIRYNEDYLAFCFINLYVRNEEFIKNIYDMNAKDCLKYSDYPEFKRVQNKTLNKVKQK